MTIIKFPSKENEPAFLNDIKTNGYQEEPKFAFLLK